MSSHDFAVQIESRFRRGKGPLAFRTARIDLVTLTVDTDKRPGQSGHSRRNGTGRGRGSSLQKKKGGKQHVVSIEPDWRAREGALLDELLTLAGHAASMQL